MPKSKKWPGGVAEDTVGDMDSMGNCGSYRDDGLEYLSAEERDCLMFLEKTIESLEAEEDTSFSKDDADLPPIAIGSLAEKKEQLSSLMTFNKLDDASNCSQNDPESGMTKDQRKHLSNCMATPLVQAKGFNNQPKAGQKVSPGSLDTGIKGAGTAVKNQVFQSTPSETKAVGILPSRTTQGTHKKPNSDCMSPRGPLSFEGLVQIRKNVSKENALPKGTAKWSSSPLANIHPQNEGVHIPMSITPDQSKVIHKTPGLRSFPPVVPPKPKLSASNILHKAHTLDSDDSHSDTGYLATSPSGTTVMDPHRVRKEALRKLGLLKSDEANPNAPVGPSYSAQPRQSLEPALLHPDFGLSHSAPVKTQLSLSSQNAMDPPRPPNPHPARCFGIISTTLARSSLGLGSCTANQEPSFIFSKNVAVNHHTSRPRASSLGNQKAFGDIQGVRQKLAAAKVPALSEATKQVHKVSVVIKPYCQVGEDRQEALRKLGLLKN